jgi:membrane-bound lytic murein transglycosylase A
MASIANAYNPVFPDTQFASNDRYVQSVFEESDFVWEPSVEQSNSQHLPSGVGLSDQLKNSLHQTARYLQYKNPNQLVARRGVNLPIRSLYETLNSLLSWDGSLDPQDLQHQFELLPVTTAAKPNTKFTGYYTPIIQAHSQPSGEYSYPIYRSPMSAKLRLLSRNMISQGALNNRGLEIAWTNDPIGLFYLQIQGSGILEFQNGQRMNISYAGSNEKPFKSLAKHMQRMGYLQRNLGRQAIQDWLARNPQQLQSVMNSNPRYVYFEPSQKALITASGLPIVPGVSVAVDTDFIPFGSVLLAEVPILNTKGQKLGSEWKILLPQDRGNAIKGPARMDIYTGKGEPARVVANRLTGFGQAYLLRNRASTQLSANQLSSQNGFSPL